MTESQLPDGMVRIGSNVWMINNLDVDHYRNGESIPQVQDAELWSKLKTGAWCYPEVDGDVITEFGKLYNGYALINQNVLAPKGFRIAGWEDYFGLNWDLEKIGIVNVCESLKSNGGWQPYEISGMLTQFNGTDEFGFNAQPAGFRYDDGYFSGFGVCFQAWCFYRLNFVSKDSLMYAARITREAERIIQTSCYPNEGMLVRCIVA